MSGNITVKWSKRLIIKASVVFIGWHDFPKQKQDYSMSRYACDATRGMQYAQHGAGSAVTRI